MMNLKETQRIKDAIAEKPENFREIIETTLIGICITDEEGTYTTMNSAYLRLLGYQRAEMEGKSFLMVVPPVHKQELKEMHDEFIEVQIEIFEKFRIVGKDGGLIDIDVDAGFSDKILGKPHKITFVQKA